MSIRDLLLDLCCGMVLLVLGVTGDAFYIRESPISRAVEEGTQVSFDCRAVPSNKIEYKWKHESDFVAYNHHRYLDHNNNRTLLFDHVDRDLDPGSYFCLAQNSSSRFSRKSKSATLKVYWMDSSLVVRLVKPSTLDAVKEGSMVVMKCAAEANPPIKRDSITWYFNGKHVPSSTKIQSDGSLVLPSFAASHAGFYHCSVIHIAGKMNCLKPLILPMFDQGSQKLQPSSFSLYETEGNPVTLRCPWTGGASNPNAELVFTWSRIPNLGDPFTMLSSSNKESNVAIQGSILTINAMNKDAVAYYVCQSANKTELKDAVFRVSMAIMYDFQSKHFSPALEEDDALVIREGEDGAIRFYLDFTPANNFIFDRIPNPFPDIKWTFNSALVPEWREESGENLPHKYVYKGRHLIIQDAKVSDRGTYRIQMKNKAGSRTKPFKVEVAFPPQFASSSDSGGDMTTINEDETLTLDCRIVRMAVQGLVKVFWKKDGLPLASYLESIAYSKNGQMLKIQRVKPENSGKYQCFVATIKYPTYSNTVQEVLVKAKLQILGLEGAVFVERGREGRIPCKTKGHGSVTVTWSRLVPGPGSTSRVVARPVGSKILSDGSLLLQAASSGLAGKYVCQAYAVATGERTNKTVDVSVGDKPRIVNISPNMTIQEGSTFYLHCSATGDPQPTINWFDNSGATGSNIITYDPKLKSRNIHKHVLKNGTLVVNGATFSDETKYTCMANNHRLVTSEQSVTVKVLTADEFLKFKEGGGSGRGMVKTIVIVVSCAIAYLALIVGLTAFCSLRMLRHRRNRALNDKLGENRHLMQPLSSSAAGTANRNGAATHLQKQQQSSTRAGQAYLPPPPQPSSLPPQHHHHPQQQAGVVGANNYYTQYSLDSNHNHTTLHSAPGHPLLAAHHAPTYSHQPIVSAPPPTPLESRSNLSSTTNSASMYTRSHFSSSTNGGGGGPGGSGPIGAGFLSNLNMSSMERLTYPRHELQTEAFLGKGEFGDVVLARARNIRDGESQSLVLVKSLVGQAEPDRAHEFHRQLDLLTRVDSDYVSRLLGICVEAEPYLLIVEYCEWGDLKQLLRCARDRSASPNMPPVDRTQKLNFCEQIAAGMKAVASQHCVHKDLAARNVLVTPQMLAKVALVGLCREGGHQADYYQDGDRPLPLRWMSPEAVIRGELSSASDVWAYAVTLSEVFASSAAPPLAATSHEELLDVLASSPSLVSSARVSALYAPLHSALQHNPDVPHKLASLAQRCLCLEPSDRPSFTDLHSELRTVLADTRV